MATRISITRRFCFEAAHRLCRYEGKCRHLHGHSYKVLITAEAPDLDPLGMVIDFSVLKERVGGWIDENWDHSIILKEEDAAGEAGVSAFYTTEDLVDSPRYYYMPENPTAENMAQTLLTLCPTLLYGTGVEVTRVEVWETENCSAIAEKGD